MREKDKKPKVLPFAGGKDMLDKMGASLFFIESNGFEKGILWEKYEKEAKWEDDPIGFWQFVGYIGKQEKRRAVCVSFHFAKVYGQRVCFFEATSRYVDHTMVREFINKHFPSKDNAVYNGVNRICFASSFYHVLSNIKKQHEPSTKGKAVQV